MTMVEGGIRQVLPAGVTQQQLMKELLGVVESIREQDDPDYSISAFQGTRTGRILINFEPNEYQGIETLAVTVPGNTSRTVLRQVTGSPERMLTPDAMSVLRSCGYACWPDIDGSWYQQLEDPDDDDIELLIERIVLAYSLTDYDPAESVIILAWDSAADDDDDEDGDDPDPASAWKLRREWVLPAEAPSSPPDQSYRDGRIVFEEAVQYMWNERYESGTGSLLIAPVGEDPVASAGFHMLHGRDDLAWRATINYPGTPQMALAVAPHMTGPRLDALLSDGYEPGVMNGATLWMLTIDDITEDNLWEVTSALAKLYYFFHPFVYTSGTSVEAWY
jgi:hypothetical protein